MTETTLKKKKCNKAKWLSEEALQIAEKRSIRQRRKGKIYPTECRVPENSKERYDSFLNEQCKEIEENDRMRTSRGLFQENWIYQGNILGKGMHDKGQKR